jgi:hypothetical protein
MPDISYCTRNIGYFASGHISPREERYTVEEHVVDFKSQLNRDKKTEGDRVKTYQFDKKQSD